MVIGDCQVLINKAITYYYKFYTNLTNQRRNLVWNTPYRTIKCSGSCDVTMATLSDFTFLLMYLYSTHGLLSLGHLGSTNTPSSSRSWMIQLSGDCPLSTTARWHTNNLSITTIICICQHAPKKHVRKKPIFMAFIAKQKYSLCCGIAFFFSIGSRGLSQVPFSSIFYH